MRRQLFLLKHLLHPSLLLSIALITVIFVWTAFLAIPSSTLLLTCILCILLALGVNFLLLRHINKINKQLCKSIDLEILHAHTLHGAIRNYRQVSRKCEEYLKQSQLQQALLKTGISDERERLRQQVSQRKKTLDYLTRFQKLLSKSFSELLLTPTEDVDQQLTETLGRVAKFMSLERVSLFQRDSDQIHYLYTNEWLAPEFPSSRKLLAKFHPDEYRWWFDRLAEGMLVIEQPEDIPASAGPEREVLQAHKIKSLIAMPLLHDGGMIGYITFDSLSHPRQWEEDEITLLSIANSLIVGTLVNQQRYRELTNARQTLEVANRQLKALSRTDALTGLANRRYFDEMRQIEFARATRNGQPLCLMLCDLDHFKKLNDSQGHLMGDEAIKTFARCLEQTFNRKTDIAARVGGEEFAVLLADTPLPQAINMAEQLRNMLWEQNFAHPQSPTADRLTVSIGVAPLTVGRFQSIDALYSAADSALYEAKTLGRNRVIAKH